MTVAVNVSMQRTRLEENNLWGFHGIMLGKIHLKLVSFICIKSARGTCNFNNPPLQIVGDFMFEPCRRVYLPFNKLLLESICGYFGETSVGCRGTAHGGAELLMVMEVTSHFERGGSPQSSTLLQKEFYCI